MTASFAAKPVRTLSWVAAALTLSVLATGCASKFEKRIPDFTGRAYFSGTAEKQPAGKQIQGTVEFKQNKDVIVVTGELTNLAPNSTVGFHIHEGGSCLKPDASDAGPHFNPEKTPHGAFGGKDAHHAGDLPPLKADATGKAVVNFTASTQQFSLDKKQANGVIGRAMIVHAQPDDPTAQPAGNSGARVACGIIRAI